jgi:ferrochelatase
MSDRAVLMLAYGSPDSLDDMEAYLSDIRGGRPMSPEFVAEFKGRYAQIGGKSPLNERTFEQAAKTESLLRSRGFSSKVYVGMRHWMPRIQDTIAQMHADGVKKVVGIVMAPHYSSMSVGRYWEKVVEAQKAVGSTIEFTHVDSWFRQDRLLDAQEAHVQEALGKFEPEERKEVKIVFSAHSLPEKLLRMGDPYDDELRENARSLADRLGEVDWMFCYQSAAHTGEPWLGPQIEDVVVGLANEGYKYMLAAPIGFVCDHVEILYDIDIGVQNIADEHGIRVERIESMNCDPVFIEALGDALEEKLG